MFHGIRRRALGVIAVAAFALTACGSTGDSGNADGAEPAPGDASAYPVTINTMFGDVTVPEKPKRVVALGWSDAETALALGVQPVGASDWLGFGGNGVGPWAEGRYDEPPTMLGTTEINYEQVAALQPDLILNTRSDGKKDIHDKLAQIAPTVGPPQDVVPYGTTWQQQMTMVSTALGLVDEGEQRIKEVETAFDEAAAAHPEFDGKQVGLGAYFGSQYGAYVQGDSRVAFMSEFGFRNKPEIDALAEGNFYVEVSAERLDLLSADLTVVFPIGDEAAKLRADPLLNGISAAQQGRLLVLDDQTLISAFSGGSTLATKYAIDNAVPLFAQTLAG
ncbi:iron complex transport system substrate-binding protein [Amycolatopsis marina]|uniref:Iron complex transport system substrate-binding protein n=1 Tax=Amycolatopsis marina TaxID=490629 RepID=A0A1I0VTJ0_9PSEU|nr:iron-siderophore ABC transporter substrate-binding protein [Amycolatopsis marina]SFA79006.1 iron complex transport system substrate-binding protein [Amycolatopsis marina]